MTYFDHNATSPLLPRAGQVWLDASHSLIGNPSSPHRIGARADTALTEAREVVAAELGADPLDIVWTSGATESNNAVLHHLFRRKPAARVLISAIEHPSVLEPAQAYFPTAHEFIPVLASGQVDLTWLAERLSQSPPDLVAVMAANNETGLLQPWPRIAELCRSAGVPYFCDAVQWIGKLPARGLGACDFVSGSAHKFGGPKGVGFLKCPRGPFRALLLGGPQEDSRRAGTENVSGVLAMTAALQARSSLLESGAGAALEMRRHAAEQAILQRVPGAVVLGQDELRLWNTITLLMPDRGCPVRWVVKLDKLGFAVSTGSACSSGREKPSHVIRAMGFSPEAASRVIRISSGWETTDADWTALVDALEQVDRELSAPPHPARGY